MKDGPMDEGGTGGGTDGGVVRRTIDPDPATAEHALLEIVASLEGSRIDELPSLYTCVDHLVETLYETPPAADAQVEFAFSYAGYRITMAQTGAVTLRDVKTTIGEE